MTDWIFLILLACIVTVFVIVPNRSIGIERAIAIGAGLFGVGALVWLLLAVGGCARKPKTAEPTMTVEPRWCMNLEGKWKGEDAQGTICVSEAEACAFARLMALKYGSFGKISAVGECKDAEEEVEP